MKKRICLAICVVLTGLGQMCAVAAPGDLLQTFLNPTPANGDYFGYSIASVGSNVLIGAHWDDTSAENAGVAYLFDVSTGGLLQTFLNPTPTAGEALGISVAGIGDSIFVGASDNSNIATYAGAAYSFNANTGLLERTFLNPTPTKYDMFGRSVAVVGDNILVGAPRDNTGATDAGAAYLFDVSTGNLSQTFLNPAPDYKDYFGHCVAGLGNDVLVGVYLDDAGATNAGIAYSLNGATGSLAQIFSNPTPDETGAFGDQFGISVAGFGNKVVVGAWLDDSGATDAGAAYLFDGLTGELLLTLLNPTPDIDERFGRSVAVVGDNILVGAPRDNTGATDAGAAYLFDGLTGELLLTLLNPTPADYDEFGQSVAGLGNNILIGANLDDISATNAGAAYLFEGVPEPSAPPVADADGPYTIYVGDTLTLDANGSTDVDDDIVSYMWDLDDVESFETDAGGQAVFDVNYADLQSLGLLVDHTYNIHVQVTDSEGQSDVNESTLRIEPKPALWVAVDIKPGSCPNPLNVKSKGVLPVAILGTDDYDVTTIDPTSIRLTGVEPLRSSFEDVATPVSDSNDCNCTTDGPDGFLDLTLKFKTQRIVEAIGDVNDGDVRALTLTGVLFDPMPLETPIEGADCILIRGRHMPFNKADINKDGVVNGVDFAIFAQNWLQSSIVQD